MLEAMGHAFFSLSLGMGAMLTYGSYADEGTNIPNVAITVSVMDTCVALLVRHCHFLRSFLPTGW